MKEQILWEFQQFKLSMALDGGGCVWKQGTGVNNFICPAISRTDWHNTEEPNSFGSHWISAGTYVVKAGDLSKAYRRYLNTFKNAFKNAKVYVELIYKECQVSSYINILLLQKLFIKDNVTVQNILRVKLLNIFLLKELIKEALLKKELQNYL